MIDANNNVGNHVKAIMVVNNNDEKKHCIVDLNRVLKALGTDGTGMFDTSQIKTDTFINLKTLLDKKAFKKKNSKKGLPIDIVLHNMMLAWYELNCCQ